MSKKKPVLNLNLTAEEIAEALKDIKPEELLPPIDKSPSKPFYKCDHCSDTGQVQVYGPGQSQPCPYCGPRY